MNRWIWTYRKSIVCTVNVRNHFVYTFTFLLPSQTKIRMKYGYGYVYWPWGYVMDFEPHHLKFYSHSQESWVKAISNDWPQTINYRCDCYAIHCKTLYLNINTQIKLRRCAISVCLLLHAIFRISMQKHSMKAAEEFQKMKRKIKKFRHFISFELLSDFNALFSLHYFIKKIDVFGYGHANKFHCLISSNYTSGVRVKSHIYMNTNIDFDIERGRNMIEKLLFIFEKKKHAIFGGKHKPQARTLARINLICICSGYGTMATISLIHFRLNAEIIGRNSRWKCNSFWFCTVELLLWCLDCFVLVTSRNA